MIVSFRNLINFKFLPSTQPLPLYLVTCFFYRNIILIFRITQLLNNLNPPLNRSLDVNFFNFKGLRKITRYRFSISKNSFVYWFNPRLDKEHPSTNYVEFFFKFTAYFNFCNWRKNFFIRKNRGGFLKNKDNLYYLMFFKKDLRNPNALKQVIPLMRLSNPVKLTSHASSVFLKFNSERLDARYSFKLNKGIRKKKNSLLGRRFKLRKHNRFFKYAQSSYSQPNGMFSRAFVIKFILKFKLATSRFLKSNINETIIRYNLKRIYRPSKFWKTKFNIPSPSFKPFGLATPYVINKNKTLYLRLVKKIKRRFSKRKARVFWISKINGKALTPARQNFRVLSRKQLIRQRRMTKLVLKYYNLRVMDVINNLEFNIVRILMRTSLINYQPVAYLILRNRLVFLNGAVISDFKTIVGGGDVIQFPLTLKFLLFLKWNLLTARENVRRFFFYLRKWRNRKFRPYPKKSSYRVPNWVRRRILFREPTASFLEVDILSLTVFVTFDWTSNFFNYHFLALNQESPAVVRPLNWKFLT